MRQIDRVTLFLVLLASSGCNCRGGDGDLNGSDALPEAKNLDFGTVSVGLTARLALVVTNAGSLPLQVGRLELGGSGASAFSTVGSFPSSIAPGDTGSIDVQFTPSQAQSYSATLSIPSNSSSVPDLTVDLTGIGSSSALVATPQPLDFGSVIVGQSLTLTLTLTNQGTTPLSAVQVEAVAGPEAPDFSAKSSIGTLPPGSSGAVAVTFMPSSMGSESATLPIAPCAGCSPLSLSLVGQGAAAGLTFSPSPIAFQNVPAGSTVDQTVTATNGGSATLEVSGIAMQSGSSSPFVLSGLPAFPYALAPQATFTFQLSYTASQAQVADAIVASYTSGAGAAGSALDPVSASEVSGPCELSLSPASLSFGTVLPETPYALTTTLSNGGTADCTLSSIALDPSSDQAYSLPATAPSSLTIPAGGSAQIEVDFETPSASAPVVRAGILTFQSNDLNLPQGSVPLTADLTISSAYDAGWPTCVTNPGPDFPAKGPLLPLTVPADCRMGFELNSQVGTPTTFTLPALSAQGSRAELTIELDFATYEQPDSLTITATDSAGHVTTIFGTCYIQTSGYVDPTDDAHRPSEDAVRDFRVPVPTGTMALNFAFDTTNGPSPWYVRLDGLCDFDMSALSFPGSVYRPFDYRSCLAGTCEAMSLCGSVVEHCGQSYDCSAAPSCDGGLLESFQDSLSSVDAAWTTFGDGGTSVSASGGDVAVTLPGAVVGVPAGLASVQHYDADLAKPACAFVHVANAAAVADAGEVEAWLALKDNDDNELRLVLANQTLTGSFIDADGVVTLAPDSLAFDATKTPDLTVCWSTATIGFGSQATGTWTTVVAPGNTADPAMGCSGECGTAVSWLPVVQVELGAQRLSAGADMTVLFDNLNIGP